ncbi:MAG: NUMOD4 domain-containing protein [Nitrosarchaeum sp.]
MNIEKWKIIKEYSNYAVSNYGRIKRHVSGSGTYKGKILKLKTDKDGYKVFNISIGNGLYKTLKVHRLVAIEFIKNPENKPQVNHKNGIKYINHTDNLEWCTISENLKHAFKNKLITPNCIPQLGSKNHFAKLKEGEVWLIKKLLHYGIKTRIIMSMFNITRFCISDIRCNKNWKHVIFIKRRRKL